MLSQIASCVSLKELRILLKKLSTFSRKHAYPRIQLVVFRGTLIDTKHISHNFSIHYWRSGLGYELLTLHSFVYSRVAGL